MRGECFEDQLQRGELKQQGKSETGWHQDAKD
jgi:hypothetical protein